MKKSSWLAIVIGSIPILYIIYYNLAFNNNFLDISVSFLINLLLALGITYYLTQRKNDERKQKEIVLSIITKFQKLLDNECAYRITCDDRRDLTINNRGISNAISALNDCELNYIYKEELEYIETQFSSYKEFIGNHNSDTPFLSKAEQELNMHLMNISSKLDSISVKLFKKP